MPFYQSPIVNIIEEDFTLTVPQVSTSIGGAVGDFSWGPIATTSDDVLLLDDQRTLETYFQTPTNRNYKDWFTIWNFLAYTNAGCRAARTANVFGPGALVLTAWEDATANPAGYNTGDIKLPTNTTTHPWRFKVTAHSGSAPYLSGGTEPTWPSALGATVVDGQLTWTNIGPYNGRPTNASDVDNNADAEAFKVIKNATDWTVLKGTRGTGCAGNWIAKYPASFGNRLSVAWRDGKSYTLSAWQTTHAYSVGDIRKPTNTTLNPYRFKAIASTGSSGGTEPTWPATLGATVVDGAVTWQNVGPALPTWADWTYSGLFPFQPVQSAGVSDELAVVVLLDGVVVETFIVDQVNGRVDSQNQANYAGNVINRQSKYVWFNDERYLASFVTGTTDSYSTNYGDAVTLVSGLDGDQPGEDDYIQTWSLCFTDAEALDVDLLMAGGVNGGVSKYIVENIAAVRKDCVAFFSPHEEDVVGLLDPTSAIIARRVSNSTDNLNVNSSYGFMDANYKLQFDQYNDVYRWLPLNGDMAGLAAQTDNTNDPWWSFAGYNRGIIKNVTKLAFSPKLPERNALYTLSINPVIATRGEGFILLGDRTTLLRPSAFRAVNVRRLFIVLEKSIGAVAKYELFEFNDPTTQNLFVQLVTPFLRDVQGRRGIRPDDKKIGPGFLVVADGRVNTPEVIDQQKFKALFLIRPNLSINFIELTFAATKTGAVFEELIPQSNVSQDNSGLAV